MVQDNRPGGTRGGLFTNWKLSFDGRHRLPQLQLRTRKARDRFEELRTARLAGAPVPFGGFVIASNYWLMKSEPEECSVDDALAAPNATIPWTGVRNYQARNFMRDRMKIGDGVLFCHSGVAQPGIVGLAEVASAPYPDPTQFEPKSEYFDPGSKAEAPRWMLVDVRVLRKTRLVTLIGLRAHRELAGMRVLQKGNRLSITPVSAAEWRFLQKLINSSKES